MPIFDKVIQEALSWIPPRPSPRALELPQRSGRADALIGLRRAGKTWRMFQQIHELLEAGVPRERMLYLNLEDERLGHPHSEDLTRMLELWEAAVPDLRARGGFLYLDEVQRVTGWERFVRRILETTALQVTVTGSSSELLAGELATALRGRCHRLELLPFSFMEWRERGERLERASKDDVGLAGSGDGELKVLFLAYLQEGGLPDVFGEADEVLRMTLLQDHAHAVVLRDVAERHNVGNLVGLGELAHELLSGTARKFSLNRFYNKLRSQGYRVSRDSLRAWYRYLQEAYLCSGVPIASRSPQVRRVNPEKVYVIDTGLALAHAPQGMADQGHMLETAVYWELRRRGFTCAWVQTRGGREVDFLATSPRRERTLIQVCTDLTSSRTQDREMEGLMEAMDELHVAEGLVITVEHEESFDIGEGRIKIIPAWRWFQG